MSWIAKAVASAAYWLGVLYLAGPLVGDRVVDGRIVAPPTDLPPAVLLAGALLLYAAASRGWDRLSPKS